MHVRRSSSSSSHQCLKQRACAHQAKACKAHTRGTFAHPKAPAPVPLFPLFPFFGLPLFPLFPFFGFPCSPCSPFLASPVPLFPCPLSPCSPGCVPLSHARCVPLVFPVFLLFCYMTGEAFCGKGNAMRSCQSVCSGSGDMHLVQQRIR
jgi:hypothetical protein